MQDWSVDLPGWKGVPDPDIAGATVWVHEDYDGVADIALAITEEIPLAQSQVTVLSRPVIDAEVDGECLGTFPDWDTALEFALTRLEND